MVPTFDQIKKNWQSGLTVALISIPLSLSLAIASGATPLQGILTAIWAGFIYAFFAGSRYNVVGPAGALSGILALYAFSHGAAALPMLAIVTGVLIYGAYLLRLERYLVFVPASSLHGFTLGVALTIGLGQVNSILGLVGLPKHEKLVDNLVESWHHIASTSPEVFAIFAVFLVGMFVFARFLPKLPGAIVLTPIGIWLGYLDSTGRLGFALSTLQSTYGALDMKLFEWPHFFFSSDLLATSLAVAVVAILETLISAKIADGMAGTHEKHDGRKEMKALALANVVSGVAGGLPATGVFARTALNVKTGATDQTACLLNSLFVAIICLFLLTYFRYIPLAVVAAILVFAAIRMVEIHHYRLALDRDRRSLWLMLIVAFITAYQDPIYGIMFGTAVALVLFVEKLSRGQFELVLNNEAKQAVGTIEGDQGKVKVDGETDVACHTLVYSIKGQLAYLNAQAHIDRFERKLSDYQQIILRCRELYFMDMDGVDAFDEIVEIIERQGKTVYVSGIHTAVDEALRHSKHFKRLASEGKVFEKTTHVLSSLGYGELGYAEKKVERIG